MDRREEFRATFLETAGGPLREGVGLAQFSNFRIGGPADFFFEARAEEDLRRAVAVAAREKFPFYVIGGGFNILFDDEGYRGLMIRNRAEGIQYGEGRLSALSGTSLFLLLQDVLDRGLAGLEFLAGITNPVGAKVGPGCTPDELVALCERLDPDRLPGRLTLITRLGAARIAELLPPLLRAVEAEGHPVVWACDPMHGNTITSESGRKTRRFDDILGELRAFFDVHRDEGTWPGGLHVELTGDDVTECLGGIGDILEEQLPLRYTTACDPRLNARQSIDLAFRVAELLRD